MSKLSDFWDLFKQGQQVDDPALWKNRQITATALGSAIIAATHLAGDYGANIPVNTHDAVAIAGGIIAIVNIVLTITTSAKVGIPVSTKPPEPTVDVQGETVSDDPPPSPVAGSPTGWVDYSNH